MRTRAGWAGRLAMLVIVARGICTGVRIWPWPSVGRLATARPTTTAFIKQYRAEQRAAGGSDRVAWTWTPYAAISPALKRAVLVSEDVNFFSHHGFALDEMQSALEDALRDGELPRGASTITQQLAKNLWLSRSRNPIRKAREALLTWQLERQLSKRRILELYLNVVEFGPGIYGVGAATQRYFGKAPADLDDGEAAQLAAVLPHPTGWRPRSPSPPSPPRLPALPPRTAPPPFPST